MMYKTIVIDHALKTKKMAAAIEKKANEMAKLGCVFINFSITKSGKAILMFQVPEALLAEDTLQKEKTPKEEKALKEEKAPKKEKTLKGKKLSKRGNIPEEESARSEETAEAVGEAE